MNRDDDLMLMAQQSLIYDIIKNFLKSDLAIQANISGMSIQVSEGYVNAKWNFGDRKSKDIIK